MNAIPMEVPDDRKVTVTLDGEQYDLVFNTRAAREVAGKYGSLTEFGEKLSEAEQAGAEKAGAEKAGAAIDMNIWLLTLLVNQGIAIRNRRDPENKKPFFTEEDIDLLTLPADWPLCKEAIIKGSRRDIRSEDDSKNAVAAE